MTMPPEQLEECLSAIRWTAGTLAQALECDVLHVVGWLKGIEDVPTEVGAWIEALALLHEKAEMIRPAGLKGR